MAGFVSNLIVCDFMGDIGMLGMFISVKLRFLWIYTMRPPPCAFERSVRTGV